MDPPEILKAQKDSVNLAGSLYVSPDTLQHVKYKNIFDMKDGTHTPYSKPMVTIGEYSRKEIIQKIYKHKFNDINFTVLINLYY